MVLFSFAIVWIWVLALAGVEAGRPGDGDDKMEWDNSGSVFSESCAAKQLPWSYDKTEAQVLMRPGKPNRKFFVYTPKDYDPSVPARVLLAFHGWGGEPWELLEDDWVRAADKNNYVVVAPEGLGYQKSWKFPGSSDGIGKDGVSVTTCDETMIGALDSCFDSCAPCASRCGWTHCMDDDVAFVRDLIGVLDNYLCVDVNHIYSFGISNGGMLTWSMGQDPRTAPLLAGLAPVIGLPHYDYRMGNASPYQLPVIGIYGESDSVVPIGDYEWDWSEDSAGFYYMSAHRMHTTWAIDHGCRPDKSNGGLPQFYYEAPSKSTLVCRTHCAPGYSESAGTDRVPYSVDCRANMGHAQAGWNMAVALDFFEDHRRYQALAERARQEAQEAAAQAAAEAAAQASDSEAFVVPGSGAISTAKDATAQQEASSAAETIPIRSRGDIIPQEATPPAKSLSAVESLETSAASLGSGGPLGAVLLAVLGWILTGVALV